MKKIYILFALCIITTVSWSQKCSNIKAEFDNHKLYIYYDLQAKEGMQCFVNAYSSKDNYKTALKYVSGAVGRNISPGEGLKIIWDVKKEFEEVDIAKLDFRVEANEYPPANYFPVIIEGKFKRGGEIIISWHSGSSGEDISLELHKKGAFVKSIVNTIDSGNFKWIIPKEIEKGEGYQIKYKNSNRNELFSSYFEIK